VKMNPAFYIAVIAIIAMTMITICYV